MRPEVVVAAMSADRSGAAREMAAVVPVALAASLRDRREAAAQVGVARRAPAARVDTRQPVESRERAGSRGAVAVPARAARRVSPAAVERAA